MFSKHGWPARTHGEGMLRFARAASECVDSDGSGEDRSETELPDHVNSR